MNISQNWLKDYLDLPKNITPEDIARKLTNQTVEVEGVIRQSEKFNLVVVGKILEIRRHPNADRLQCTKTEVGNGLVLDIVCGAPNIEVGMLVPVAMIGAILPNGIEIREADVRGEKSQGMLCAPDELGLGNDHSGIMVLDANARLGQNFAEYLKVDDVVFEIDNKSLSNRPDLWGHFGIARDLSAILNMSLKTAKLDIPNGGSKAKKLDFTVEDTALCPRYMAIELENIKIAPSPSWLQERLIAVGLRPINNIVDITNYVMYDLGQPLHAFDAEKISRITVRSAKKGEEIETLDGNKHELNEGMIVIADDNKPIGIAGIMGGSNSEVSDNTTKIIIESANFDYVSIRKTSTKLQLRTEASMRFEKGLDPNLCETAISKAVRMIMDVCPEAVVASQLFDVKKFSLEQGPITFDYSEVTKKIGADISEARMIEILERLGFQVEAKEHHLLVGIPSWRATRDVAIVEDLVEEIVRIEGYDKIVSTRPNLEVRRPDMNRERYFERKIKELLAGRPAMTEVMNYSFVSDDQLKKIGMEASSCIKLKNPIASNLNLMRQSLIPNLLSSVKLNQARFDSFGIFELGSVYLDNFGQISRSKNSEDKLPYQEKRLGLVLATNDKKRDIFSEIKGIVEYLFKSLDIEVIFSPVDSIPAWVDENFSASIDFRDSTGAMRQNVGLVYKLDMRVAKSFGLKKEVSIVEIGLPEIFEYLANKPIRQFVEFEKFPAVLRDIAIVINERVLHNDVKNFISGYDPLIKKVELFDVYEGDSIGHKMRSLAFHISFQSDRTLTSKEVDGVQTDLIKALEDKFEAKIRE